MSDYYREHCRAYFSRTFQLDPESFLSPLTAVLPAGASVLDVGCGSGRDLLWLKQRGYRVMGLEHAAELAVLARQATGCLIIEADFKTFDFGTVEVDAVLMVGSLVHLPHAQLPKTLRSIIRALPPLGWVLMTLKLGSGKLVAADGREFYLWEPPELGPVFDRLGLAVKHSFSQSSIAGSAEIWLTHLLQKGPGPA